MSWEAPSLRDSGGTINDVKMLIIKGVKGAALTTLCDDIIIMTKNTWKSIRQYA